MNKQQLLERLEILAMIVEIPDDNARIGLAIALFSEYGDDVCKLLKPYLGSAEINGVYISQMRYNIPEDILKMYATRGGERPLVTDDLSQTFFSLDDLGHTVKSFMKKYGETSSFHHS